MSEIEIKANGGILLLQGPDKAMEDLTYALSAKTSEIYMITLPDDVEWTYIDKDGKISRRKPETP
jgi:hypothetical protein